MRAAVAAQQGKQGSSKGRSSQQDALQRLQVARMQLQGLCLTLPILVSYTFWQDGLQVGRMQPQGLCLTAMSLSHVLSSRTPAGRPHAAATSVKHALVSSHRLSTRMMQINLHL